MADIATLGISVDSSGVASGVKSMEELVAAARKAENAVASLAKDRGEARSAYAAASALKAQSAAALAAAKASGAASSADIEAATAARTLASAAASVAKANLDRASAAHAAAAAAKRHADEEIRLKHANDNIMGRGAKLALTSNLAAQFQDVAVTAAMMQNPLQIALQQGLQIQGAFQQAGLAAGGLRGMLGALGAAFASLANVTTLAIVGVVGLIAGLVQLVPWAKVGAAALNAIANVLPKIAGYATIAAGGLALLYAPSILAGMSAITVAVVRLTAYLAGLVVGFALANPYTAFALGVVATAAVLVAFRDQVSKALGFDLIGNVKYAINWIVGAFVGAFNGIKELWSSLPAAIGDVAIGAANAVIGSVENMINFVSEKIDAFLQMINKATDFIPPSVGGGTQFKPIGRVSLSRVENPYAGRADAIAAAMPGAITKAQGIDYVGKAATAVGKAAKSAATELKSLAKSMLETDDDAKKTKLNEYERAIQSIQKRTAELKAETAAQASLNPLINDYGRTVAYAKAEQELLTAAKEAGKTVTAKMASEIRNEATAYANATAESKKLEEAQKKVKDNVDFAKGATKGFLSDLRSGLQQGQSFWESFGNAALNVLNKIIDKIETQLVDALFSLGNASGGGSNLMGGLLGGLGKLLGFANGGAFGAGGVQAFANGGAFTNQIVSSPTLFKFASGVGLMGEAGDEAIMPLSRDGSGRLGVKASIPPAANSNSVTTVMVGAPSVTINGNAGNGEIKRLESMLAADRRARYADTVRIVNDARSRGHVR